MNYTIVGLGNPGKEYEKTRHNTGRMLVQMLGSELGADWKADKKLNAQVAKVKVGKSPATLVLPDTFMNKSGASVKFLVSNLKMAGKLVVIYDDIDLPFGTNKISFDKSSGGHRGLESIIRALKTQKFARVRVGIAPTTATGKIKKPSGKESVIKHIMGKFKSAELAALKKLSKKVNEALETFVVSGLERVRNEFN